MAILMGDKALVTNLAEGVYPATIKGVKETEDVTFKAGSPLPAIIIEFELEISGKYHKQTRKYIASDQKGSELRTLLEELISGIDFEEGVDLHDLIGKKCRARIVENISSKGNRFQNISTVQAADSDE